MLAFGLSPRRECCVLYTVALQELRKGNVIFLLLGPPHRRQRPPKGHFWQGEKGRRGRIQKIQKKSPSSGATIAKRGERDSRPSSNTNKRGAFGVCPSDRLAATAATTLPRHTFARGTLRWNWEGQFTYVCSGWRRWLWDISDFPAGAKRPRRRRRRPFKATEAWDFSHWVPFWGPEPFSS